MQITFLGGADEVGASCLLIEIAGRRLLVDAGIRPTPKARWGLAGDQLPDLREIERRSGIDAILVTHAHADHTGALELVCERFPGVPLYATPVTGELTRVLHQDAQRIMRARLEEEGELPLFDEVATARLVAAFTPVAYHQPLTLAPGLTATFFPAGHIAGAAMIGLASAEGRILISGDISISPQRTVDGARPPAFRPDVLVLESTYGGKLHANRAVEEQRLVETVAAVTGAGGKVLIPAFALGRAQELLLTLGEFLRRGALAPVPVWADGMVRAVCQAYASFPEALPLALQEQGATFFDANIQPVTSAALRNALIWEPGPAVIVSSSGMLAGGPAQAYARALAGQPQHAILLTGYQDEESPGRRLQEMAARGRGTLRLGKDKVDVQCRLATYSLSAHADSGQLVSFVETLDPAQVFLVHGDEEARTSLAVALRARGRRVRLPRAGQSFGFQFTPLVRPAAGHGLGRGQRLDLRRLWELLVDAAGGSPGGVPGEPDDGADAPRVTLDELARTWWGDQPGPADAQLAALAALLREDTRYFVADPARPELHRLRSRAQVALANRRQAQLAAHGSLAERWLLVRNPEGEVCLARAVTVADDHVLAVESPGAGPFLVWPEDILSVLDGADEAAAVRARMVATLETGGAQSMEPNRVLAFAQAHFPPAARLRRTGYRLTERVLVLTFDFPAVVRMQYAEALEELAARTGWQIEVTPEASQEALAALVAECLPAGWRVVKGPAIHRQGRRVAVSVLAGEGGADLSAQDALAAAQEKYLAATGYALDIAVLADGPQPAVVVAATPGSRLEINAAYAAIKAGLAGTTLYRTSLKDGVIVLAFISRQVGERHRARIEALAQQVGWPLSIYPQPNQGAILEAARRMLQLRGWTAVKGPGIHLDRSEVAVTLAGPADPAELAAAQAEFLEETGFRLALTSAPAGQDGGTPPGPRDLVGAPTGASSTPLPVGRPARPMGTTVEIPIAQLRLQRIHEGLALNPAKLENAIARVQRAGQISPPVVVRRLRDGYLLLDGLYRLRAAQALGYERIPAVVEA